LDTLAGEVTEGLVLILGARRADIYEQLCDGVYGDIGQPGGCTEAVALNQKTKDLRSFGCL